MRLKTLMLPTLLLTCLSAAVAGCSGKTQTVVLTPPKAIMAECPSPKIPDGLRQGDIKQYTVAATRYIIDLQETLDVCNGKLAGLREWSERMEVRHERGKDD